MSTVFDRQKSKRGNPAFLTYGLKTMAEILHHNDKLSITAASQRASQTISTSYDVLYTPKTLRTHYQRLVDSTENYLGALPIFPQKLGNTPRLNLDEENELVKILEVRISNKNLGYPNIETFLNLCYSFCGYKYSHSWMSKFLKDHGFNYGPPRAGKVGTRYHDSKLNINDRISFLLRKIWYIAWERVGKVVIYIHDESWINEKPSGTSIWSSKNARVGTKIEGRRFAFSSLWSVP